MRGNHFRSWFVGCSALLLVLGTALSARGANLSQADALARLDAWRESHPLMQVTLTRPSAPVVVFPEDAAADEFRLYVVGFEPQGYAVVNGDDLLPPVVAFAADSRVWLDDDPQNAFYALLLDHVADVRRQLADGSLAAAAPTAQSTGGQRQTLGGTKTQYGPHLFTSWNQTHPYNLLCPPTDGSGYGYNGKAAVGCVPLAFAQVMRYHNWPPYGKGRHSYYDNRGSIQGYHEADFTEPLLWETMQNSYSYHTTSPQPGEDAVASAVYRLAVAAEVNFEHGGTSGSISYLGNQIANFFYYETPDYYSSATSLFEVLDQELIEGRPVVVGLATHAVVADGILINQGSVTYHLNYGYGGLNDGWYDGSTPSFEYGSTQFRPTLRPLPELADYSITGDESSATINWHLPPGRVDEIASLQVKRLQPQSGLWNNGAENFDHAISSGWSVINSGRTGQCWYAGPNGEAYLTLTDEFEPSLNTVLSFYLMAIVYKNEFHIQVSTDQGATFTTIQKLEQIIIDQWTQAQIDLGPYAGSRIMLRFYLGYGSYYSNGGVWLDDLSLNSGTWHRWDDYAETSLPQFAPLQAVTIPAPPPGEHMFAVRIKDQSGQLHALGAPLRLSVISDFLYRIESSGSATITGCSLPDERVVIPTLLGGASVGSLAAHSFTNSSLVSLTVPSSVATIEANAFAGSSSLSRILFSGNAPGIPNGLLASLPTTVYYLPGTSGWGSTFGGRPALLWNPAFDQCLPDTPTSGSLQLTITGTATIPLRVESSDGLNPANWALLDNVSVGSGGRVSLGDPATGATSQRFYRIIFP